MSSSLPAKPDHPSCDLLIRGGLCVTGEREEVRDIAVRGGRIVGVGRDLGLKARRTLGASGKLVLPGAVDMHVHFGIPMTSEWCSDDPDSGSLAALAGGVTTVGDFTVPAAGHDPIRTLEERMAYFSGRCRCDYTFHLTLDAAAARSLAFMKRAADQGVRTFKIFTCYPASGLMVRPGPMAALFGRSRDLGALILIHAEDEAMMARGRRLFIARGKVAPVYHALSRPPEAELRAVRRCLETAGRPGGNIHFVHLSTGAAARAAAAARAGGASVTCETCPQYLLLDDRAYKRRDGELFILSPPLRPAENRKALWDHLSAGRIQAVATDHCPFYSFQKRPPVGRLPFHRVPGGLPGVETSLRLLFTRGVSAGRLDLRALVRLMCENPARILGLYPRKGTIRQGSDADIVIFDPDARGKISSRRLHTRSDYSPYEGMSVRGRVETVILRGKIILEAGRSAAGAPSGMFIPQKPYDKEEIGHAEETV